MADAVCRSSPIRNKPVADARLRQDAAWLVGADFNLLAEVADVNAERLDIGLAAFPRLRQEMAVREHLALMQHQFV